MGIGEKLGTHLFEKKEKQYLNAIRQLKSELEQVKRRSNAVHTCIGSCLQDIAVAVDSQGLYREAVQIQSKGTEAPETAVQRGIELLSVWVSEQTSASPAFKPKRASRK